MQTKKPNKAKTLEEMGISVYLNDTPNAIFKRMVHWVKRYMVARKFDFSAEEERCESLNWANGDYQTIALASVQELDMKDIDYFHRLTRDSSTKRFQELSAFVSHAHPQCISISNPVGQQSSWTCLNEKMSGHNRSWRLYDENERPYTVIHDFQTLLAETFLLNRLHDYIANNRPSFEEWLVRYCRSIQTNKSFMFVPTKEAFKQDFKRVVQLHFPDMLVAEWEHMNRFEDIWNVKDLKDTLIQDWSIPAFASSMPKVKMLKKVSSGRVGINQTNSHIKSNVAKLMKNNAFLTHFGEVELHNELNIEEFHRVEKDFEIYTNEIPIPIAKEYFLRIKKLGNYNAGGLHFGDSKDIILDVNAMDTFTHEIGHMTDKVYAKNGVRLCDSNDFRTILELYTKLVTNYHHSLQEHHPDWKQWTSKNKYNKRYYLSPEEIFARCFEIYVRSILKDNRLVPSYLHEKAYPRDEELYTLIKAYFDSLLQS